MDSNSCAQTEDQYAAKEAEFLRIWNTSSGSRAYDQYCSWRVPSWYNAPTWAQWLRFCMERGWVFVDREPYVYPDGVVSADCQLVRACDVPGVLFFDNKNYAMGGEAPFWVTDRRKQLESQDGN